MRNFKILKKCYERRLIPPFNGGVSTVIDLQSGYSRDGLKRDKYDGFSLIPIILFALYYSKSASVFP